MRFILGDSGFTSQNPDTHGLNKPDAEDHGMNSAKSLSISATLLLSASAFAAFQLDSHVSLQAEQIASSKPFVSDLQAELDSTAQGINCSERRQSARSPGTTKGDFCYQLARRTGGGFVLYIG